MRRLLLALPLALLALPATASAATTCSLNTGTHVLTVTIGTDSDTATLVRDGSSIDVRNGSTPVACANNPTVTNTDDIVVNDAAGANTTVRVDMAGGQFEPGFSDDEPLSPDEIEMAVNFGDGTQDFLDVAGGVAADVWQLGDAGVNLNAGQGAFPDGDSDLTFPGAEQLRIFPGNGNNVINATGGVGTGGPLATRTTITSGTGNDNITGGNNTDDVTPGTGDDQVNTAGNADIVRQGVASGDDFVDGGPGNDTITYQPLSEALRVDLGLTQAQQTGGGGNDRLINLENVTGGQGNDTLIGSAASNQMIGQDGNDLFIGKGGDDDMGGQEGNDTVSYELPPPGVTQGIKLDLRIQPAVPGSFGDPQVTGGAGSDGISEMENLRGSPFADELIGNDAVNTIVGLGGTDTVTALGGADVFELRDGVKDTATCGTEADRVTSDVAGVDVLNADCETVALDVRPETTLSKGPKAVTSDRTPTFVFSSSKGGTIECRVDSAAFVPCTSPYTTARLGEGSHTFEVRARDTFGALDLTPARQAFRIDRSKPSVGRASITKVFRVGKRRTKLSAVKRGTTIRYRLSEAANVRIVIQRKKGKRFKTVRGTIRRKGKKGANKVAFSGRLGKKALKPGKYRAVLTATDAAGNRSKAKRLNFRIVR